MTVEKMCEGDDGAVGNVMGRLVLKVCGLGDESGIGEG